MIGNFERIPVARIIDKVDALFNKNDYTEAGRLLAYWRDEAVSFGDKHGELAMESELVGYYRKQNDCEKGLASIAKALTLTEELGQTELASGATILINCATAYKAFGMAKEALPLYIRAEQTYRKVLAPDDARFGGLYNNMALALVDLKQFEQAESAYLSALDVMQKVSRGEAESAITYINMAHMYEDFGKQENIQECMQKAYSLLQSDALPRNGYYAFVLEKCAPSFGHFGDAAICEQMKKEAEEIYARA
ncbi:MAG: tetratricopeptide repeat protein [Faecalimonas sp.]|nr:tetratricopeptide repeat protein [Faecalimonas sp.]